MKKLCVLLSAVIAVAALFAAACAPDGGKDEWDGVQIIDNSFAQTMQAESGIVNPPAVVCDVTAQEDYDNIKSNSLKPASVILRLNDKFNVVDTQGKKLCSFSELYNDTLKGKIIPIIRLTDEAGAQRAVTLFTERYDLLDAAVISDEPALVKTVREDCTQLRGIVEFNALEDVYDAVRITNANLASVAVIPQSIATQQNVFYLQARFKTVWVRPESTRKLDLYQTINSGAYGVVAEDYLSVIDALGDYKENSFTRMPFVVAHRGLPNSYNENSVSGAKAAIEAGATHIELDGYLTTDNRIALMHDNTVDRTSDGTGVVEDYKLEDLQKFKLDLFEPKEAIPSLDDIFEVMKGTDAVLLFEIKSQKAGIVNALKTALGKHDMWRQVVVISFNSIILETMAQELPEVPTACLLYINEDSMEDALFTFGLQNSGCDAAYGGVTAEMNAALRDRGIIGWYWTYDTVSEMTQAMEQGFTGLTTNVADEFVSSKYIFVKGGGNFTEAPAAGAEVPLIGVTYSGREEQIKGNVFYVDKVDGGYAVIASYTTAAGLQYTQLFLTLS